MQTLKPKNALLDWDLVSVEDIWEQFKKTGRDDSSSTTWHIALERKVYGQQQDSDGLQSLNRDHLILRWLKQQVSSTQLYHQPKLLMFCCCSTSCRAFRDAPLHTLVVTTGYLSYCCSPTTTFSILTMSRWPKCLNEFSCCHVIG